LPTPAQLLHRRSHHHPGVVRDVDGNRLPDVARPPIIGEDRGRETIGHGRLDAGLGQNLTDDSGAPVSFVETADGNFVVNGIATFTLSEDANQAETDAANTALNDTNFTVNQDARS
jgi:hypothetical protein